VDIWWGGGRNFVEKSDMKGRNEALDKVAKIYLHFPENLIGIQARSVHAGLALVAMLKEYPNEDGLQTLDTILNRLHTMKSNWPRPKPSAKWRSGVRQ